MRTCVKTVRQSPKSLCEVFFEHGIAPTQGRRREKYTNLVDRAGRKVLVLASTVSFMWQC